MSPMKSPVMPLFAQARSPLKTNLLLALTMLVLIIFLHFSILFVAVLYYVQYTRINSCITHTHTRNLPSCIPPVYSHSVEYFRGTSI